ncbi:MAG: TauD/TfdA family dioxygenase [Pseudomonadota bacterium]
MDRETLRVVPLGHALGAELQGVDITRPLGKSIFNAIRSAWHEHHVIVFRDVNWTVAEHLRFSAHFGTLDTHDATPHDRLDGQPEILEVTNKPKNGQPSQTRNAGRNWHSDYSYTAYPAAASMLFCDEVPSVGGDTMFCNMVRAYETLSPKMRGIVDSLESVFDFNLVSGTAERDPQKMEELLRLNPPIAHPAVRVHPGSGKRALYVSHRTSHFEGMRRSESLPLINYLCELATKAENVYRHRWRTGDLVCWDNRTTMHIALADFDPSEPRRMLRTTLKGARSGVEVAPALD